MRRGVWTRRIVTRERLDVDGVTVKRAGRPSGLSAKAEMDDLASTRGAARRQARRRAAEAKAVLGSTGDA